ncbi:unnamed protein product [Urochloa humidicola]
MDGPVQRERTRSPRRRDAEFSAARQQRDAGQGRGEHPIPSAAAPQNKATPELQDIFTKQAVAQQNEVLSGMGDKVQELSTAIASLHSSMNMLQRHLQSQFEQMQAQQLQWMRSVEESLLTGRLRRSIDTSAHGPGNGAWSATVPACQVFARLRDAVPVAFGAGRPMTGDIQVPHHSTAQQVAGAQYTEEGAQPMDVDDRHESCTAEGVLLPQPQVADLFTTPEPPVLPEPPQRRQRTRRTFDMSAVLQQYIDGINRPLPESIIAALTTFLDLDDTEADAMTEALIEQAGEGLEDLQHVEGAAVPVAA